jgi:photosystem I subunit 3
LSHAAEFILPGFGFIYITGWIGWVGRKYIRAVSTTKNPAESEIIINVPLALKNNDNRLYLANIGMARINKW